MHQNHVNYDIQEDTFLNRNIICFQKSIDVHLRKYNVLNVKLKHIQDKNNSIEFNVIGTKTYYDINVRVKP